MGRVNASRLRDKAARLVQKGKYDKAVDIYHDLEEAEPQNADWSRRAADCYRRLDDSDGAVEALARAADKYAKAGFLVKAVAVCKMILALDPDHTDALEQMAALQRERGIPSPARRPAKRTANAAAPAKPRPAAPASATADPAGTPPTATARPTGPEAPPPGAMARHDRMLGREPARPSAVPDAVTRTIPPGAALDSISLAEVVPEAREVDRDDGEPSRIFEIPIDDDAILFEEEDAPALELAGPGDEVASVDIHAGGLDLAAPSPQPEPPVAPVEPRASASAAAASSDGHGSLDEAFAAAIAEHGGDRDDDGIDVDVDVDVDDGEPDATAAARSVLPRTPLFSDLSPSALQQIIGGVELVELGPGEAVFSQGDAADAFYVVSEGAVAAIDEGPPRVELGTIGEGQFFGEIGVVTDQPRNATIQATEPTELLRIQRDVVGDLVDAEPGVLKIMLRFLRDRLIDNLVRTSPLFEPFQGAERAMLASRFKFLEVDASAQLVEQGQRAAGLYVLLTGRAEVTRAGDDGDRELLATLGSGDLFGEMSLLSGEPAVAGVRAASKCYVLELPGDVFREIIMTHPQVLMFVGDLADERRRQNQSIASGDQQYAEGHLDLF